MLFRSDWITKKVPQSEFLIPTGKHFLTGLENQNPWLKEQGL